jgi:hypothetical protein
MKYLICLILFVPTLVGCRNVFTNSDGILSKSNKSGNALVEIQKSLDKTNLFRLSEISSLSYGETLLLNNITNKTPELIGVNELNNRVSILSGPINTNELPWVYNIVSYYESNNIVKANKLLNEKDKSINNLLTNISNLNIQRGIEYSNALVISSNMNNIIEELNSFKSSMKSKWGIVAIGYGFKILFIRLGIILGILGSLYLIIRIFANSNPYIGMLNKGLSVVGGVIAQALEHIFPGSSDRVK